LPHFDVGKPDKHASWDDEFVVHYLTCLLVNNDVVLLTENTRLDELGLRRLLRDRIGPQLDNRVSLTGLFRRGKTGYEAYCVGVIEFATNYSRQGGYHEILI
jgi:hypothetical protein